MRNKDQGEPDPSNTQPYILGRPDLNTPDQEEIPRLTPRHPSDFRSHEPDLIDEEYRLSETIQSIESATPETQWTDEKPKGSYKKPIALIILSLAILVTVTHFIVRTFVENPNPEPTPTRPSESLLFTEAASAAEINASTKSAVRGFMEASTYADRCHFVVGGSTLEDRMRNFYQRPENPVPNSFGSIIDLKSTAFVGTPMQIVSVAESNGHSGWTFNMLPTSDRMLIDWESSVGYGELSWPNLLNQQPTEPLAMRVYLHRCHRYLPPFTDESSYEAFEITARGYSERLFGYALRNSPLQSQLQTIVPEGASQPVHITLRWKTKDPDCQAVEITSLLHNFWINPDPTRLTRTTPQSP